MDMLNLTVKNGLLRKIIAKLICKRLKCNANVSITELALRSEAGLTTLHISGDVSVQDQEIMTLLESLGIL